MAATERDERFLVIALILSIVAIVAMVSDKIFNPDIVNRELFDLLQFVFSLSALVFGVIVIVQTRRRPEPDESVIDLRERLGALVDLDDVEIDRALDPHR
jgi:hypothetical protein